MEILQSERMGCGACKGGIVEPFPFTMAFQPIVDVDARRVYAYEALVRGTQNESAYSVLSKVTDENRYAFDQSCRVKAITLASRLGLVADGAMLSINFIPGAVYNPAACIRATLAAASAVSFPLDRLIFEITEVEAVKKDGHLLSIVEEYRGIGFKMALDDVGAGWSGLNLIADIPANILKVDMALTRNLHQRPRALAVMRVLVELARSLGMEIVAEGIETVDEYVAVRDCGISLMQGYLLARPAFQELPGFTLPEFASLQRAS